MKNGVVKVNKLQQIEEELMSRCRQRGVCLNVLFLFVCMCESVLLPVSCSFLLAACLPADLSVLLSLQGCEMTHQGAHLGPCNLFQMFPSHFCFPNCVSFLSFSISTLVSPALDSLTLLSLSRRQNGLLSLVVSRDLMFPVWIQFAGLQ